MKAPTICPYCGGKVILTDSFVLYGEKNKDNIYDTHKNNCRKSDKIYFCTNCNASVGCHKGTSKPLGTLANFVLRAERRETHRIFDKWWQSNGMTRSQGYTELAKRMNLPKYKTHIGQFDMAQCEQVIRICCNIQNIDKAGFEAA